MNRNQATKLYKTLNHELDFAELGATGDRKKLLDEAWIRNLCRDAAEREAGYAANSDCPPDLQLRTVITALWAAVAEFERDSKQSGLECIAEAIAMTQWLEANYRKIAASRTN